MIKFLTFQPTLGVRCPSPGCLKTDMLLKLSGVQHKHIYGDVRKAPRGKFPVIIDGDKTIPDSSHIYQHLVEHYDFNIDEGLSKEELAISKSFQRLIEDHHYYMILFFRWVEQPDIIREAFFNAVPSLIRKPIFNMVRGKLIKMLHLQGTSRHTREELIKFADENLAAVNAYIGNKKFFFGSKIRSIDTIIFGSLEQSVGADVPSPIKDLINEKYPNLIAYCERIRQLVYEA